MKKACCMIVLLLIVVSLPAQHDEEMQGHFLEKSKKQKIAGYVTLGGGIGLLVPGIILLDKNTRTSRDASVAKDLKAAGLVAAGVGLIISSIVLFSASDRNRKEARRISVKANQQLNGSACVGQLSLPSFVALTMNIN
jgi:hypothetical protein